MARNRTRAAKSRCVVTDRRQGTGSLLRRLARWVEAEREIDKYGLLIRESVLVAGVPTVRHEKNPAINISHEAVKLMKSFLIEIRNARVAVMHGIFSVHVRF